MRAARLANPKSITISGEHTCNLDFWDDHGPASAELLAGLHYSTNWYANRAISKIQQHPKDQGLYIHLTW